MQKEAYEHQVVLTDLDEIFVEGNSHDISNLKNDAKKIQELFRAYVQGLELLSLQKNPNVSKFAQAALDQMYQVLEQFRENQGIDLIQE
jgi:hypothetical protein